MLKRELKVNLKSLIIWTSILVIMFIIVFAIYPSITSSIDGYTFDQMLEMFPKEMMSMFNMDIVSIQTVSGWFKTEGNIFLLLCCALYSSILGASILAKEEEEKTIEFLYSKPISRNNIVTSKVLCGLINITLMFIIVAIVNLIGMKLSNDLVLKDFLLFSFSPLLTMYPLFFISMFVSILFKKPKRKTGIAIGIAIMSYFLQIVGNMSDSFKWIKYFSVFELTPSRDIFLTGKIDLIYIVLSVLISMVFCLLIYITYNKKELV